jgi:hypothetical protein
MSFKPYPKPVKKQKAKIKYAKIAPVKKSRAKQNRQYKPLADKFKLDNPNCQIKHDGCTIETTDVHHTRGRRGKLLLDMRWWKASCRSCHRWATDNSKEAKEKGASYSINHTCF